MPATLDQPDPAITATSALDFDVIVARASEIKKIAPEDVTDSLLGGMFGLSRETIWHYRHGGMKPRFDTVCAIADGLGLTVDEIRAGNPSPPKPAGPSTPTPPSGPKPASPSKAVRRG